MAMDGPFLRALGLWGLCCLFWVASAHARELSWVSEPDWVQSQIRPAPSPALVAQARDGEHYLLLERQYRFDRQGRRQAYRRFAVQVLNTAGLESAATLSFEFDPLYQQVQLHRLEVWRDGQRQDRRHSVAFRFLEQEREWRSAIYSGRLTLELQLQDLRVGDIVEYSGSIVGNNPIYQGLIEQATRRGWGAPVERVFHRIVVPEERRYVVRRYNTEDSLESQSLGDGWRSYHWSAQALPAQSRESQSPAWWQTQSELWLSELHSWQQVRQWSQPLYAEAMQSDAAIEALAERFKRQHPDDPLALVGTATHYVQDRVRYLGLEMGTNSHRPSPAGDTLRRRFGDCKDKTVLLITLLKALGVEAYPALVDTEAQHTLAERPARLLAFDHVVVQVRLGDRVYWVDPTVTQQRGRLGEFSEVNLGWALVLDGSDGALTQIEPMPYAGEQSITEHYRFDQDQAQSSLTVVSDYRGNLGERERERMARGEAQDVEQNYLDYYRSRFSGVELAQPLKVQERAGGVFQVREAYRLDNPLWDEYAEVILSSGSAQRYLPKPSSVERQSPWYLGPTLKMTETQRVSLPFAPLNSASLEEVSHESFYFSREVRPAPEHNRLDVVYQLERRATWLPPEALDAYAEAVDRVRNLLVADVVLPNFSHLKETPGNLIDDEWVLWPTALLLLVLVYAIGEWYGASQHQKPVRGVAFYPVSKKRFVLTTWLTMGLYIAYWVYKNYQYLKRERQAHVNPWWRGVLSLIYLVPLHRWVEQEEKARDIANAKRSISTYIGIGLYGLIFITSFFPIGLDGILLLLLLSPWTLLPLLVRINTLNGQYTDVLTAHSAWSWRHRLLALCMLPLALSMLAEGQGLITGNRFVGGEKMWPFQQRYIREVGQLAEDEQIEYFYSASLLDFRNDGQGLTQDTLFSYWLNQERQIEVMRVPLRYVKSIGELTQSGDNSQQVDVELMFGKQLMLYLPDNTRANRAFLSVLRQRAEQAAQADA